MIIDISQGMTRDHPNSLELLNRDIENIVKDFKKLKVDTTFEEIKNEITGFDKNNDSHKDNKR